MRRIRLLIVALTALTFSLAGATAASAGGGGGGQPPDRVPDVGHLAPLAWGSGPGQVTVLGSYRCWGPSDAMHLWVSVKQGGVDPTREGSSTTVNAWYDTNVSMDTAVTCNGRWQTVTVDLGRHDKANHPGDDPEADPPIPPSRPLGYLHHGAAWLQFCLVDTSNDLLDSGTRWVQVVGVGHR